MLNTRDESNPNVRCPSLPKSKEVGIIKRNKDLAKDTRGILSLTAQEQERLCTIINENEENLMKEGNVEISEAYLHLKKINDLLQVFSPRECLESRQRTKRTSLKKINKLLRYIENEFSEIEKS